MELSRSIVNETGTFGDKNSFRRSDRSCENSWILRPNDGWSSMLWKNLIEKLDKSML